MFKLPAGNLPKIGGLSNLGIAKSGALASIPGAGALKAGPASPEATASPGSNISLGREAQGLLNQGGLANGSPLGNQGAAAQANNGLNDFMKASQENQKQINNLITIALAADAANKVLQLLQALSGKNKEGGDKGGGGGGGGDEGDSPSPEPDPEPSPEPAPPDGQES